jgi:hypothetical protein
LPHYYADIDASRRYFSQSLAYAINDIDITPYSFASRISSFSVSAG